MKSAIILLAATCRGANAAWLRWSLDSGPTWSPQETSMSGANGDQSGWTPKPTQAPGTKPEGDMVLDLLRRQDSTTTWTNSGTCGWFAGISSSAVECGGGFKCETNTDNVVACVSATISNFYSACLDYSAHLAGSCDNVGPKTGCCTESDVPACGTYLWTSAPERSMYKCFETASVITILDVPQFVIDASLASKSRAMTQTSSDSDGTPATPTDGGSPTGDPVATPGNAQGDPSGDSSSSSSSTTNIGAIAGGVVGGVAALALIVGFIMFLLCRRRKRSKSTTTKSSTSKEKKTTRDVHSKETIRDNNNNTYTHTHSTPAITPPPLAFPAPVKESSTTSSSPNARSSRDARREARRERHHQQQQQQQRGSGGGGGDGSGSVSVSYTVNNSSHTATFARQPSDASRGRRRRSSSEDDHYEHQDRGGGGGAYDEVYGDYHRGGGSGSGSGGGGGGASGSGKDINNGGGGGGGGGGGPGFVGGPGWRQSF